MHWFVPLLFFVIWFPMAVKKSEERLKIAKKEQFQTFFVRCAEICFSLSNSKKRYMKTIFLLAIVIFFRLGALQNNIYQFITDDVWWHKTYISPTLLFIYFFIWLRSSFWLKFNIYIDTYVEHQYKPTDIYQ